MIPISLVIQAPLGFGDCLLSDDLLAQADGESLEIIVADGSPDYVDHSRPGFRHVRVGTSNVYAVQTAGVLAASKEWVLLSEDHAIPLPGMFEAFREAIQQHPDADVFSGALENLTSTSPWSFAFFLYGDGHRYWSRAPKNPDGPSSANTLIRRSAILDSELADIYGVQLLTMPRLARAGRHRHCPNAAVDHVLHLRRMEALRWWFGIAERTTLARRSALPPRPPVIQALRDCAGLIYLPTIGAWRTMLTLRGTPHFRAAVCLRLMMLGLANAAGVISIDVKRLLGAV